MIVRKVIQDLPLKPFNINELKTGTHLPFDVYIKDRGLLIHYLSKGALCTAASKEELNKRGISTAFVHSKNEASLQEYLESLEKLKAPNFENPVVFQKYSINKEKHFQIDRSILQSDKVLTFDILVTDKFHLKSLLSKGEIPLNKLKDYSDIEGDLLIKKEDANLYLQYLDSMTSYINENYNKENIQFVFLKEKTKHLMMSLLEDPKQEDYLRRSSEIITGIIECIMDNKNRIYEGFAFKNMDYYTYTHSLNVALLSIGLAIELGLKRTDIEKLALGALLHDIGKSVISPEIINKQGRLNSAEYKIIRIHVTEGEKILREHKELHEDSLIPLLQHHEKLSGNGYPSRLKGKEIKLFGRITAIADCYDALTTSRPYRVANTPFYALSIIAKETGDFDPALLKIFIKMLGA